MKDLPTIEDVKEAVELDDGKLLQYYTVSFDGLDKTGKSTMVPYLARMSNFTLNILDRGPITNIVWNKIQGRHVCYDVDMWKKTLFVRLTVNKEDWEIRCKVHNEADMPKSFEEMTAEYDEVFSQFKEYGFQVMEFNTSEMTEFQIATEIMKKLEELNKNIS